MQTLTIKKIFNKYKDDAFKSELNNIYREGVYSNEYYTRVIGKNTMLENTGSCNQQINAIVPNNQVNSNYVAFSILAKRRII